MSARKTGSGRPLDPYRPGGFSCPARLLARAQKACPPYGPAREDWRRGGSRPYRIGRSAEGLRSHLPGNELHRVQDLDIQPGGPHPRGQLQGAADVGGDEDIRIQGSDGIDLVLP